MAPPRNKAAHTWGCVWLSAPTQDFGEIQYGDDDARDPLQDHQLHKHAVGAFVDRLLVLAKLFFCEVQD